MRLGRSETSSGSAVSSPASTRHRSSVSAIPRAKVPSVSREGEKGLTPAMSMAPWLGLKPTTPQKDAGRSTEPAVWLPSAAGTMKSPTAAAEPLEEPPGVWAALCGLRVLPGVKKANSVVTVLPRMTAPARRSLATVAASAAGRLPA